jgi:hypothetical protein
MKYLVLLSGADGTPVALVDAAMTQIAYYVWMYQSKMRKETTP